MVVVCVHACAYLSTRCTGPSISHTHSSPRPPSHQDNQVDHRCDHQCRLPGPAPKEGGSRRGRGSAGGPPTGRRCDIDRPRPRECFVCLAFTPVVVDGWTRREATKPHQTTSNQTYPLSDPASPTHDPCLPLPARPAHTHVHDSLLKPTPVSEVMDGEHRVVPRASARHKDSSVFSKAAKKRFLHWQRGGCCGTATTLVHQVPHTRRLVVKTTHRVRESQSV